MHRTSLYLKEPVYEMMVEKADEYGISISELLKRVISKFLRSYSKIIEPSYESVCYQPSSRKWHTFSIRFSDTEYEHLVDFRKVWKISVSFIVSMAFLYFINDEKAEDEEICSNEHSYVVGFYEIVKKIVNDEIIIVINWGKTEQKE